MRTLLRFTLSVALMLVIGWVSSRYVTALSLIFIGTTLLAALASILLMAARDC